MPAEAGAFNLWLAPAEGSQSYQAFHKLIKQLTTASDPATLPFEPHVTLLSSSVIASHPLEVIAAKVEETVKAAQITQVICEFDKVEAGEAFFQCVYVKLLKPDSEGLLSLHRALRHAFGDTKDPEGTSYFPHMSLVYGDLPVQERQSIVQSLHHSGTAQLQADGRESVLEHTNFEAKAILVVNTRGNSDQWTIGARIPI